MPRTNVDAATERHQYILVTPDDALRHARRAAGVQDVDVVVAPRREVASGGLRRERCLVVAADDQHMDQQRGVFAGAAGTLGELGSDHERDEIGVVEDVGEFVLDIAVVDVDPHRAQLEHRPHGLDPLDAVESVDSDVVTATDPLRGEMMGELVGACLHLRVRTPRRAGDEVIAIGPCVDRLLEEVGEVERSCPHRLS